MLCVLISIASLRQFNEYTQHTIILSKIHILSSFAFRPGAMINLSGSNFPFLEQILMFQRMFEPFKFDCTYN